MRDNGAITQAEYVDALASPVSLAAERHDRHTPPRT